LPDPHDPTAGRAGWASCAEVAGVRLSDQANRGRGHGDFGAIPVDLLSVTVAEPRRSGRWMMLLRLGMSVVVMAGLAAPAVAGIPFFSRKPKVDPAEQVPSLVLQLKTDKDEAKRAAAAEELRNFDPKAFPEMMTALSDALLKDGSASVRAEAASTIARLRPINPQAGYALEQAAANDPALRCG
jgi:hypothetical protein